MRRILIGIAFGVFVVAAAAGPAHRALAQLSEEELQRKAEAFVRLWEQLEKTQVPEERIAWSEEALKLEGELDPWPLSIARKPAQARLWMWSGLGYIERRDGNREENLERAIVAYERAAPLFARDTYPGEWVWAQESLGSAYQSRIRGDRAGNLEKSIDYFEAILTARTREATPQEWAWTLHTLAGVYRDRIRGSRADNQEKAIALYEAALSVRTREALSQEWAATQYSLAVVYGSRVRGDRAENVEKSIEYLQAALSVRNPATHPREWADTQRNLGLAFGMRQLGEKADNSEKAIATFEAALTVLSHEDLPGGLGAGKNRAGNSLWQSHPRTANRESGERDPPPAGRAEGLDPRGAPAAVGRSPDDSRVRLPGAAYRQPDERTWTTPSGTSRRR